MRAATWRLAMAVCAAAILLAASADAGEGEHTGAAPAGRESAPAKLGSIQLDRAHGSFTVPGAVLRIDPPLEYLAVSKGGMKGYEALFELNTDAKTFNLACILLGLNAKEAKGATFHFDPNPLRGDAVRLWISWAKGDKRRRVSAGECLDVKGAAKVAEDWVYTGSTFTEDGRYLAESEGTIIGFVHDPASIIEHRAGLGLGNYGAVGGNPKACPPVGTEVLLTVERATP